MPRGGSLPGTRERRETRRVPDRDGLGLPLIGFVRATGRVPIGVVKLLRARGGCLGVIRWWAWKAAKSSGELPNEH